MHLASVLADDVHFFSSAEDKVRLTIRMGNYTPSSPSYFDFAESSDCLSEVPSFSHKWKKKCTLLPSFLPACLSRPTRGAFRHTVPGLVVCDPSTPAPRPVDLAFVRPKIWPCFRSTRSSSNPATLPSPGQQRCNSRLPDPHFTTYPDHGSVRRNACSLFDSIAASCRVNLDEPVSSEQ